MTILHIYKWTVFAYDYMNHSCLFGISGTPVEQKTIAASGLSANS